MKLKKIASLALAGVMAVSMLAGCKAGDATTDDNTTTVPVVTNTLADKIKADLTNPDILTFKADSTYDAYLAAAIKGANLDAEDLIAYNGTTLANAWASATISTGAPNAVYTKLMQDLSRNVVDLKNSTTTTLNYMTSVNSNTYGSEGVYAGLYVLNGEATEDVLATKIASAMDAYVAVTYMPGAVVSGNTTYDRSYNTSVSVQKVASGTASTWFVLVVTTAENAAKL